MKTNPVIVKELRGRMRGARAFIVLTAYLLLLSCLTSLLYLSVSATQATVGQTGPVLGKLIFGGVVAFELFVVCFMAPAFTAGAISGEREKRTYDLLITTLLPARSIVLGKLISALAYVVLLILAAVPLESLAFMLGGVAPEEVIIASIVLLVTALGYGSIGIFYSSLARSSTLSTVLTYATVLLITLGIPIIGLLLAPTFSAGLDTIFDDPPWTTLMLLIYFFGFLACTNPPITVILTEVLITEGKPLFLFTEQLDSQHTILLASPWLVYTVFYLVVSVVLIRLSIRRIEPVRGRRRHRDRE
jgi:ABC-2 type transport system permease protein